ncbi:helix-turn-helix domain-containing protein [Acinetobacter sp. ANC 4945]|uniref:Transcriptional regulator n=1 Tax=Acinetobacter amyesii TaxID=2942470 RepID=A0A1T1GQ30_9GAMM|nr:MULTISPECIES: helix-turn-helix transcriptional regulator [Acinetobacter]MCL6248389.1 helix-turn-helix domain-containing protein [Acinetobacter amyesii]OOV79666.1 transcriptional regulator [Acinetobacter amyesii]QXW27663.1 helix-turn-helix domain-containing protein [Acinetobacter johnsonii]
MNNITLSIHSDEYVWLRKLFIQKRNELGLSQRALADRLGVIYSFVAKVETGDRKLDIFEFLKYCEALELDAHTTIQQLITLLQDR